MSFDLPCILVSGFRKITPVLLVAVVSLAFNVIEIRCQSGGQNHLGTKATEQIVVPMSVDVDGAPTSYGPDDAKALDYELNAHVGAKKTGRIVGYLTDSAGNPVIQTKDDPAPGFYVSTTGYMMSKIRGQTILAGTWTLRRSIIPCLPTVPGSWALNPAISALCIRSRRTPLFMP